MTLCYHLSAAKAMICRMFLNYRRFWSRWRATQNKTANSYVIEIAM